MPKKIPIGRLPGARTLRKLIRSPRAFIAYARLFQLLPLPRVYGRFIIARLRKSGLATWVPISDFGNTLIAVARYGTGGLEKYRIPRLAWEYIEVFVLGAYDAVKPMLPGKVFLDVGSGYGSTVLWAWLNGARRIIAIEVGTEEAMYTVATAMENSVPVEVHREDATKVDYTTLLSGLDPGEVIAKVDCEGCEVEVIPKLVGLVSTIIVETHWNSHEAVLPVLRESGYKCVEAMDPRHREWVFDETIKLWLCTNNDLMNCKR